jgi:general secretion pathway protein K
VTTRRAQQGVAVVVAILVVALATSTAIYLLWHQSLWLRQVENLTARAQADVLAHAAASWAAAILAEDNPAVDHLDEPWAQPMPALAAERAALSGVITDEQGKFNVNNLVNEAGASVHDLVAFQRLLAALGLPIALADAVVDWLDPDDRVTAPSGAEDPYYLGRDPPYRAPNGQILDLGELDNVKGFTPEIVKQLAPFATALPEATPVNVNTAPLQVLQALVPNLTAEDGRQIIERRRKQPFASRDEFMRTLSQPPSAASDARIDVKSRFFRAEASVSLGRVVTGYRALLQRSDRKPAALVMLSQIAI